MEKKSVVQVWWGCLLFNISVTCILPFLCVLLESSFKYLPVNLLLIEKWFIFWAIGIRLFTTGLKQASDPCFTANKIFRLSNKETWIIIRELGIANICLGIGGILSLINAEWRQLSAISGGLFFCLAGLQHLSKKIDSKIEMIAMIADFLIFIVIVILLIVIFYKVV